MTDESPFGPHEVEVRDADVACYGCNTVRPVSEMKSASDEGHGIRKDGQEVVLTARRVYYCNAICALISMHQRANEGDFEFDPNTDDETDQTDDVDIPIQ